MLLLCPSVLAPQSFFPQNLEFCFSGVLFLKRLSAIVSFHFLVSSFCLEPYCCIPGLRTVQWGRWRAMSLYPVKVEREQGFWARDMQVIAMTIPIVGTSFLPRSLFRWIHPDGTHRWATLISGLVFGERVAKNHHLFVGITKHTVKGIWMELHFPGMQRRVRSEPCSLWPLDARSNKWWGYLLNHRISQLLWNYGALGAPSTGSFNGCKWWLLSACLPPSSSSHFPRTKPLRGLRDGVPA